jgi:hypothetical protein
MNYNKITPLFCIYKIRFMVRCLNKTIIKFRPFYPNGNYVDLIMKDFSIPTGTKEDISVKNY